MNAKEFPGIELRLECSHAVTQQMRPAAYVDSNVFALGFNPVDLVGLCQEYPARGLDCYSFKISRLGFPILENDSRLRGKPALSIAVYSRFSTIERHPKPLAVDWLQQVVERAVFKSLKAILIVGGNKDDYRHSIGRQRRQHIKAVHLGHLNVEENKVGPQRVYAADGLVASGTFADDLDLGVARKQCSNFAAGKRLVVHD